MFTLTPWSLFCTPLVTIYVKARHGVLCGVLFGVLCGVLFGVLCALSVVISAMLCGILHFF